MTTSAYDVVVIGAGPGGYVAALRAAQLGLKTAVIEKENLGGICLNWGCIPTKAMLKGAEVAHTLDKMGRFGFSADKVSFDIQQLVEHSRSIATRLSGGVAFLMKKNNITVIDGHARFVSKGELSVHKGAQSFSVRYSHCIIATGARPRMIPGLDANHPRVWTYFEAIAPKELPDSVLVVGAGAIGSEFASMYADLGSNVTLVEIAQNILPAEDADVSRYAAQQFSNRGMDVRAGVAVHGLEPTDRFVQCVIGDETGEPEKFDVVIVAVGVQANVGDIGLRSVGVKIEHGSIATDRYGATNVVGVYAIGDVAGPPCLAHKASREAIACVENLAGVANVAPLDRDRVPACTYSRPQVASVGLTESAARAAGYRLKVGRFDLSANGKALAIAESDGFAKTVFDADTGELLGAHMIGPEVTEQIQGPAIAQVLESTDRELAHAIFPHPTVSEAIHEAVLAADGRAIHS